MPASNIVTVGTTEKELAVSPFIEGQYAILFAATGTPAVYGTSNPGRNDAAKYLVFQGLNLTTGAVTSATFPFLLNAHVTATPDQTNKLRVIVKVNGVVQARIAAAGSPTAGQFKIASAGDPAVVTLTIGGTIDDNAKIEVILRDADEIVQLTGGALVANVRNEVAVPRYVVASADAYIERLLC
jgi:hypothetical protein